MRPAVIQINVETGYCRVWNASLSPEFNTEAASITTDAPRSSSEDRSEERLLLELLAF